MNLNSLISRFDVEIYQQVLGNEIIGTLKELGNKYLYAAELNKILNNNYSLEELLLNPITRRNVFLVMKRNEVEDLIAYLEIEIHSDPWKTIESVTFKGVYLEKLFDFFNLVIPDVVGDEWIGRHKINPEYPLYNYQNSVLLKIQRVLKTDQNRVLLHMPTGSGKTRTTISYICRYLIENEQTNVVWFANTVELLDQAYNEFQRAWTK